MKKLCVVLLAAASQGRRLSLEQVDNATSVFPGDYDWDKSSMENYDLRNGKMYEFTGFTETFSSSREKLDYTYHGLYDLERQLLQDSIMESFLNAPTVDTLPREPLLLFTMGAMAAGKGFLMRKLEQNGLLQLDSYVRVDMDELRAKIPEFDEYINRGKVDRAGLLTQKEVSTLDEVLFDAARASGKNVHYDGSLRDATWFLKLFAKFKEENKKRRIALLFVDTPWEMIQENAANRAARPPYRKVPPKILQATFEQVNVAIESYGNAADPSHGLSRPWLAGKELSRSDYPIDGCFKLVNSKNSAMPGLSDCHDNELIPSNITEVTDSDGWEEWQKWGAWLD